MNEREQKISGFIGGLTAAVIMSFAFDNSGLVHAMPQTFSGLVITVFGIWLLVWVVLHGFVLLNRVVEGVLAKILPRVMAGAISRNWEQSFRMLSFGFMGASIFFAIGCAITRSGAIFIQFIATMALCHISFRFMRRKPRVEKENEG